MNEKNKRKRSQTPWENMLKSVKKNKKKSSKKTDLESEARAMDNLQWDGGGHFYFSGLNDKENEKSSFKWSLVIVSERKGKRKYL